MLYSNGTVFITKNATLFVKGDVVNNSADNLNLHNVGKLYLTGDLVNQAGVLFQSSSSGTDTISEQRADGSGIVDTISHKVAAGAVYFVGCDTQRIIQRTPSKGILFNDIYHRSHLSIAGGKLNVVGGVHFNGTHHIFNGGNDICLFEVDSVNHDLCRGYLSGERNSSRLYGSGKLRAIANTDSLWWQLDSLGLSGLPKEAKSIRVVRGDSVIADAADGSLARYYDIIPTFSIDSVNSVNLTIKYFPSHYVGRESINQSAFALFSINPNDPSPTRYYQPIAGTVDLAKQTVTGKNVTILRDVVLPQDTATRFTIASTDCKNPPQVDLGSDVDVCYDKTVTLNATPTNYDNAGRGLYAYTWSNGARDSAQTLDSLTHKPNLSYTYMVMVQDRFGCRGYDTITVRCHPLPRIERDSMVVGRLNLMCQNEQIDLYANALDCQGVMMYTWQLEGTAASYTIDSIFGERRLQRMLDSGRYNALLTCTSNMGCISRLRKDNVIYVEQMPDIKMEFVHVIEYNGLYTYRLNNHSETFSITTPPTVHTHWTVNGGPITTYTPNHSHTFTDSGSYDIKLVTGGQRCRDSVTQVLHVVPHVPPTFTTPQSAYCAGEVVRYTNATSTTEANVRYRWHFGDGSMSAELNPEKVYVQAGSYTDTLVAIYHDRTEKMVARTLTVHPLPRAGFGVDTIRTCGSYYTLTAQNSVAAAYRWNDGSVAPSFTATQNGTYSVTLTSAQGCTSTESIFVALNQPTLDEPMSMGLGSDRTVCGSALLDAQNPGSSYLWSNGSTNRTLEATQSGTYGVRVTHSNGCTDSAGVTLIINPKPDAALGSRSVLLCEGSSVALAPVFAAGNTYLWSNGSTTSVLEVAQAGAYSVSVSNGLCTSADTVQVFALPVTRVELGPDRFLCNAEPTLFTLPAYLNASSVAWYKDGGEASAQFSYLTSEAGLYSVRVVYPNGCTATDTVKVEYSAAGVYVDFLVASVAEVGDSLHLIDLSYPEVTHRTWTFSDGFSSAEKYLYHAFYTPGDKVVTLTAGNEQCVSQRSKRVSVVDRIIVEEDDSDSTQLPPENLPTPEQKTVKYVEIEEVKAYPNPTGGDFYVAVTLSSTTDLIIEVYGVSGALVRQRALRRVKEHTEPLNLGGKPGLYMVQVKAGSERKIVKVLINNE
jgi:PKD repeat protein